MLWNQKIQDFPGSTELYVLQLITAKAKAMKREFKVGDYIYYRDKDGNTFPGKVITLFKSTDKYIRVSLNHFKGDQYKIIVKVSNCELQ